MEMILGLVFHHVEKLLATSNKQADCDVQGV